jgi:plasmanylethanolamine desaturase
MNMLMTTVEGLGIVVFALLCMKVVLDLAVAAGTVGPWAVLGIVCFLAGMVVADLFTGFGHFFADNFGSVDTPILGHVLIYRFRQHHELPQLICQGSFREINGGLCLLMFPIPALYLAMGGPAPSLTGVMAGCFLLGLALFGAGTNQVHRWAHDVKVPAAVAFLQGTGLLLSKKRHSIHHRAPYHLHFCITNGLINPLLDRTRAWHHLADLLAWMGVPQAEESVMGHRRAALLAEVLAARGAPPSQVA